MKQAPHGPLRKVISLAHKAASHPPYAKRLQVVSKPPKRTEIQRLISGDTVGTSHALIDGTTSGTWQVYVTALFTHTHPRSHTVLPPQTLSTS